MFLVLLYAIMVDTLCTDLSLRVYSDRWLDWQKTEGSAEVFLIKGSCNKSYYPTELLSLAYYHYMDICFAVHLPAWRYGDLLFKISQALKYK